MTFSEDMSLSPFKLQEALYFYLFLKDGDKWLQYTFWFKASEWLQLTFLTLKYWKFIQFDHFFLFFNIINV